MRLGRSNLSNYAEFFTKADNDTRATKNPVIGKRSLSKSNPPVHPHASINSDDLQRFDDTFNNIVHQSDTVYCQQHTPKELTQTERDTIIGLVSKADDNDSHKPIDLDMVLMNNDENFQLIGSNYDELQKATTFDDSEYNTKYFEGLSDDQSEENLQANNLNQITFYTDLTETLKYESTVYYTKTNISESITEYDKNAGMVVSRSLMKHPETYDISKNFDDLESQYFEDDWDSEATQLIATSDNTGDANSETVSSPVSLEEELSEYDDLSEALSQDNFHIFPDGEVICLTEENTCVTGLASQYGEGYIIDDVFVSKLGLELLYQQSRQERDDDNEETSHNIDLQINGKNISILLNQDSIVVDQNELFPTFRPTLKMAKKYLNNDEKSYTMQGSNGKTFTAEVKLNEVLDTSSTTHFNVVITNQKQQSHVFSYYGRNESSQINEIDSKMQSITQQDPTHETLPLKNSSKINDMPAIIRYIGAAAGGGAALGLGVLAFELQIILIAVGAIPFLILISIIKLIALFKSPDKACLAD